MCSCAIYCTIYSCTVQSLYNCTIHYIVMRYIVQLYNRCEHTPMLTHVFNICTTSTHYCWKCQHLLSYLFVHTVTPHTDTTHMSPEEVTLVVVMCMTGVMAVVVLGLVLVLVLLTIRSSKIKSKLSTSHDVWCSTIHCTSHDVWCSTIHCTSHDVWCSTIHCTSHDVWCSTIHCTSHDVWCSTIHCTSFSSKIYMYMCVMIIHL